MAEQLKPIIVVKRVKKVTGGHHGGAWKIAYADFVTAMMAFFLLMWLLGSTSKGDLEGVAEYFKTPLKVALNGGPRAGTNTSIIDKKGKENITKKFGPVSLEQAMEEIAKLEKQSLEVLKKKIEDAIDANENLRKFKNQLLIDITSDGLRIQIIDELNRPMFLISGDELQPYAKVILKEIGSTLNGVPNRIGLSGHTDGIAYSNGEKYFSNWELSTLRANASRRELILGGMDEKKVLRVVGLGSAVLFDKNDPLNPSNRRINIIVLNKKAEEKIIKDDSPEIDQLNDIPSEIEKRNK